MQTHWNRIPGGQGLRIWIFFSFFFTILLSSYVQNTDSLLDANKVPLGIDASNVAPFTIGLKGTSQKT